MTERRFNETDYDCMRWMNDRASGSARGPQVTRPQMTPGLDNQFRVTAREAAKANPSDPHVYSRVMSRLQAGTHQPSDIREAKGGC